MKRFLQYIKLYLVFLFLFEAGRLYFMLYTYAAFSDHFLQKLVLASWQGFRLDLSAGAYCILPFLLMWLSESLFKKPIPEFFYKLVLGIELGLIALITISDPELFLQWGNKFNNQVLVYMGNPAEMALSTGAVNWGKTALFLLFLIPLIWFCFVQAVKIVRQRMAYSWQYTLVILFNTAISFVFLRGGVGVATISQASAIHSSHYADNVAAVNSLWNAVYYIVNDNVSLYGQQHRFLGETEAKQALKKSLPYRSDEFRLSKQERPNIVVIMLESFTANASQYFSTYNNCTPYLDELAKSNLSFTRCFASGDRTEKGLVAINSGYPAQPLSSIAIFPDKVNQLPGLSKSLKAESYYNSFIYSGESEFASMNSYLTLQKFDKIIDKRNYSKAELNSKWGAHDEVLYAMALKQLDQTHAPFYSLIMSISSHEPYDVPYTSDLNKNEEFYQFKNSIRYADLCLKNFMEACKSKPWYKNTLFVLVADHGHEIGLEGIHYFSSKKFHIPLIVCGGALEDSLRGKKIETIVSQTIIPKLVLETLGLDATAFNWQSGLRSPQPFAQCHFSNGFVRVQNEGEFIFDNVGKGVYFKGDSTYLNQMKTDGRLFQEVLIDDFLKK